MIRVLAAALLFSLLVRPGWAEETVSAPSIVGLEVGFAGHYKAGLWTPLDVTLRGASEPLAVQVAVTIPDGDGVPSRYPVPATGSVELRPDQETRLSTFVKFGRVRSEVKVELVAGDQVVARRIFRADDSSERADLPPALLGGQELIVVVGPAAVGAEDAAALGDQWPEEKTVVVRLEDPGRLPERWYGYEGVDALLLSTSEPKLYEAWKSDDPRVAALEQWVRMGGKLILCAGREAEQVLQPGMPLARFSPGRLARMVTLRQTAALETYAGSQAAITAADGGRLEMRVPLLADVSGAVEAREANLPLVVRRAFGFGQVVWMAGDLDLPPLADWEDRGLLLGKLLDRSDAQLEEVSENRAVMHYGFTDMAGQLRSALDHFRGVRLVPFALVVGILVVYILAIGPGDYFFLRKFLKRMELTWVTFPLIVLTVCVGAYFLAGWLKGDRILVNQVDLIDVDAETGRLRGTAWANLFSPKTDRYNLTFEARSPGGEVLREAEILTSWLGLPGEALGGMNPKTVDPMVWKVRYEFSPKRDAVRGVPVPIWSTKSLTARWTALADRVPEAEIGIEDGLPVGTITNTFDFPLADCMLACGNWAYELGTIGPGESVRVGAMLKRRELRTLLTGRKVVFDKEDRMHEEITPYDQSSIDLPYILRAMMFFDVAGGSRYTGLLNRYQSFVDLSDLLKTDRAILVAMVAPEAKAEHHGAVLLRDGQPLTDPGNRHESIYRFVFPVQREGG